MKSGKKRSKIMRVLHAKKSSNHERESVRTKKKWYVLRILRLIYYTHKHTFELRTNFYLIIAHSDKMKKNAEVLLRSHVACPSSSEIVSLIC